MKIEINIPDFHKGQGFKFKWEPGFEIEVKQDSAGSILVKANKAGLISLANHFLALSNDAVPLEYHIHLDDLNSLEAGSCELIIEKK